MSINTEINRLLNFAKQNMLINEDDYYYAANRLLDVLKVDAFEPEFVDEKLPTAIRRKTAISSTRASWIA
jgi:UDPglucose--hexose-1-phosphate uridylyltransferase